MQFVSEIINDMPVVGKCNYNIWTKYCELKYLREWAPFCDFGAEMDDDSILQHDVVNNMCNNNTCTEYEIQLDIISITFLQFALFSLNLPLIWNT